MDRYDAVIILLFVIAPALIAISIFWGLAAFLNPAGFWQIFAYVALSVVINVIVLFAYFAAVIFAGEYFRWW